MLETIERLFGGKVQRSRADGTQGEDNMVSAFDVVAYILVQKGQMSAMKLQKLLYYSQAWSLVWDDSPLFKEPIEAWANGPVVPEVFNWHRGQFRVARENVIGLGDPERLSRAQKETVDAVLRFYGDRDAQWLSDLTHMEDPWRLARGDLPDGAPSAREITLASMAEYYSSLKPSRKS